MCENIFTVKEAMALLKVSNSTIRLLLKLNKIEYFMVRNRIRISEAQLNSYLASVKVSKKNQMLAN